MKISRLDLIEAILIIFDKHNISKNDIRGSFVKDDFHFIQKHQTTFSDIDLFIKDHPDPTKQSLIISKDIFQDTKLSIPVSIHTQEHLSKLSISQSQDLALLECIYQAKTKRFENPTYITYIFCKFALLISRTYTKETYGEIATRLNTKDAKIWYDVKRGDKFELDLKKEKIIWPHVDRNVSFWEMFFQNRITDKIAEKSYRETMVHTRLPLYLKERIIQKLGHFDVYYE